MAQNDSTDFFHNRHQKVLFFLFRGMEWDLVHLVRRSLIDLLYKPGIMDECREVGGIRISRGDRSTRRKLAQGHFVHRKSHMIWPGIEPGPPRWEAGDRPPELWMALPRDRTSPKWLSLVWRNFHRCPHFRTAQRAKWRWSKGEVVSVLNSASRHEDVSGGGGTL
jgi:hypothetical protein